jgi:cell division protease FtsH
MGAFTPDYPPVNKITVVPRSHGIGGFTQYRDEEEKTLQTQSDLINEVDVMLGGRAAEQVVFGEISTGAANDISRATDILKRMITDFGMSEKFKNMTLGKGVRGYAGGEPELIREFSEETQKYIDEEIARIMNERYEYAVKLLTEHKELLDYIATRLMEKETMDGKEFAEIIKGEQHCKELSDNSIEEKASAEKASKKSKAKVEEKPETEVKAKPRTRKKADSEAKKSE